MNNLLTKNLIGVWHNDTNDILKYIISSKFINILSDPSRDQQACKIWEAILHISINLGKQSCRFQLISCIH